MSRRVCRPRRGFRHCFQHSNNGAVKTFKIHKLVASAFLGPANGQDVDHINNDKQNNHVSNLRYVSTSENCQNVRRKMKNSLHSQFIGVGFANGKWRARIRKHPIRRELWGFGTEIEAAHAYDQMAIELYGENCSRNFMPRD